MGLSPVFKANIQFERFGLNRKWPTDVKMFKTSFVFHRPKQKRESYVISQSCRDLAPFQKFLNLKLANFPRLEENLLKEPRKPRRGKGEIGTPPYI